MSASTTSPDRRAFAAPDTHGDWCRPLRRDSVDHPACCLNLSEPPQRPNLAIYSQEEQLGKGLAPNWISVDINYNFTEVSARVRNLSQRVSAVNAQVGLFVSGFGLGLPRSMVGMQRLNFAPGQEIRIVFPLPETLWGTPEVDGFTNGNSGWHIRIEHPHDSELINNRGSLVSRAIFPQQVGQMFASSFAVFNDSNSFREINLSVLQNALGAVIQPASRQFAPMEQFNASLTIDPSLVASGKSVTVVARLADGTLLDGLTQLIL